MSYSAVAAMVFIVATALAAVLTPLARRIGLRYGITDMPGGRRKHHGLIPRLGGIPIYAAFCAAVLLTRTFPRNDPEEWLRVTGILVGATAVFLGGLLDDRIQLKPLPQVAGMAIIALMAIPFKDHQPHHQSASLVSLVCHASRDLALADGKHDHDELARWT